MLDEAGHLTSIKRYTITYLFDSVYIGGDVGGQHFSIAGFFAHQPLPEGFTHFGGEHPLKRVHSNQSLNDVLAFLGNVVVEVLEMSFSDFLEKLALVFCAEWVVALKNHEKEDAKAPEIGVDGHMILF